MIDTTFLTEGDLATHWKISMRTLQRWRIEGKAGPDADALAFEDEVVAGDHQTDTPSAETPSPPSAATLTLAQAATLARVRKFLGTKDFE